MAKSITEHPRLRANGRNTSNTIAPTMLGVGSGVQTDATTPNNAATCSASWEGCNPYVEM